MSRLQLAREARRHQLRARVALDGPSGAGKTWTALQWATVLADGGPILLVDTEHGSAELYADAFTFETLPWDPPYDPGELAATVKDAGDRYPVIVIDSASHFWEGEGGTLDIADAAGQRASGNSFAGWKVATPALRHLIDTILASPAHVIVTMRTKTEWVIEQDKRGRNVPKRVGTAPVMRAGVEYEFTIIGELDLEHRMAITKSRCVALADQVVQPGRADEAAETFANWLKGGEPMPDAADVQALKDTLNAGDGKFRAEFKQQFGHPDRLTVEQLAAANEWVEASRSDTGEVADGNARDSQGAGADAVSPGPGSKK